MKLFIFLITLCVISIIFITIVIIYITKKVLKPLKDFSEITENISKTFDTNLRLNTKNFPSEIHYFAKNFNIMLDKINQLLAETREISNNIAHDIKTPLTAAKFNVEKLLLENHNTKNEEILGSIIIKIDKTIHIVNSILSVSEFIHNNRQINFENIDIIPIITEFYELFYDIATGKNIDFKYHYDLNKARIKGNKKILQRIISNLIDNAIRYTPENKSIRIFVYSENKNICISFQDTGIGIQEEEIKKIFHKFYKIDKSRTNEGCGLGLHIVKVLTEKMNGKILVKSKLNEGSEFILSFSSI